MENWEALKALTEKKSVRLAAWQPGEHITPDFQGVGGDWPQTPERYLISRKDGWEIYDPRTEDDVDRSAVYLLYRASNNSFGSIRGLLVQEFGEQLVARAEARAKSGPCHSTFPPQREQIMKMLVLKCSKCGERNPIVAECSDCGDKFCGKCVTFGCVECEEAALGDPNDEGGP
jgi:hypothetical protein